MDDRTFKKIEKYLLSKMETLEIPSVSIAIAKNRDVIWSKGLGYADLEEKIPATTDTAYFVGCTVKPVSATGVLQFS